MIIIEAKPKIRKHPWRFIKTASKSQIEPVKNVATTGVAHAFKWRRQFSPDQPVGWEFRPCGI